MAVTFVKRSTLPVPVKGKVGVERVTVDERGQLQISGLSMKVLGGKEVKKVALGYDSATRAVWVIPQGHKSVAKMDEKDMFDIRPAKQGNSAHVAGAGVFLSTTIGDYDYRASGLQSFATETKSDSCLVFTLPKGKLTPPVKVVRAPRKKNSAPASAPTNGAPAAPPAQGEELVLESA